MVYLESTALGNCHHAEEAGTSLRQVPQATKLMLCPFKGPLLLVFLYQYLGFCTGNTSQNFIGKEAKEVQFLGVIVKAVQRGDIMLKS